MKNYKMKVPITGEQLFAIVSDYTWSAGKPVWAHNMLSQFIQFEPVPDKQNVVTIPCGPKGRQLKWLSVEVMAQFDLDKIATDYVNSAVGSALIGSTATGLVQTVSFLTNNARKEAKRLAEITRTELFDLLQELEM